MEIKDAAGLILGDGASLTVWFSNYNGGEVKQLLSDASYQVYPHSKKFCWGTPGKVFGKQYLGASQLAAALLLHYTNDKIITLKYTIIFRNDFIDRLAFPDFTIDQVLVINWIKYHVAAPKNL